MQRNSGAATPRHSPSSSRAQQLCLSPPSSPPSGRRLVTRCGRPRLSVVRPSVSCSLLHLVSLCVAACRFARPPTSLRCWCEPPGAGSSWSGVAGVSRGCFRLCALVCLLLCLLPSLSFTLRAGDGEQLSPLTRCLPPPPPSTSSWGRCRPRDHFVYNQSIIYVASLLSSPSAERHTDNSARES